MTIVGVARIGGLLTIYGLAIASMSSSGADANPPFTVLEGRHAQSLSRACSRADPPKFQDTWQPSEEEIQELEQQLPRLQQIKSSLCCGPGRNVENVLDYYRQYLGIVVKGRKVIYINALSIRYARRYAQDDRWRREPIIVCDGGAWFWGAIYDPETKEFSRLAFNGVA